jgi:uncharacterized protein DUF1579
MKQVSIVLAAALFLALPSLTFADDPPASQTQTPQTQTPPAQTPPAQVQTPPPAQEPPNPTPKMAWSAGPPAELKKLSLLKGKWTSSMHTLPSPLGPESVSPAKSSYDWSFNGMHLEGTHQFQINGKPTQGRSTWGWDPEKKQYQIVWSDATYPASFIYYGTFANDNMLVCFTTYMLGGRAVTEKMTYAFTDPDHYTMTMESDVSGELKVVLENKNTRAKPPAKTAKAQPKKPATTTKKAG